MGQAEAGQELAAGLVLLDQVDQQPKRGAHKVQPLQKPPPAHIARLIRLRSSEDLAAARHDCHMTGEMLSPDRRDAMAMKSI